MSPSPGSEPDGLERTAVIGDLRWLHTSEIEAVAFQDEGRKVISIDRKGAILRWDVETGKVIATWSSELGRPTNAALSADGRRGIVVQNDGWELWDLESGSPSLRNAMDLKGLTALTVRADGDRAYAIVGNLAIVLDLETGKRGAAWAGAWNSCAALAGSTDGRRLVAGDDGGTLHLWDPETGEFLMAWKAHDNEIVAVAINHDGSLVASKDVRGIVKTWQPDAPRELGSWSVWGTRRGGLAYLPDGRTLLCAHGMGIILSEGSGGRDRRELRTTFDFSDIVPSSSGKQALAFEDRRIRPVDLETGQELGPPQKPISGIVVDRNGEWLLLADDGPEVVQYEVATGKQVAVYSIGGKPNVMRLTSGGGRVLVQHRDGNRLVLIDPHRRSECRRWDLDREMGEVVWSNAAGCRVILRSMVEDDREYPFGARDIWTNYNLDARCEVPRCGLSYLPPVKQGERLVLMNGKKVWSLDRMRPLYKWQEPPQSSGALFAEEVERALLYDPSSSSVTLRELKTGEILAEHRLSTDSVPVDFEEYGIQALSLEGKTAVVLWDAETGRNLGRIPVEEGVAGAAFAGPYIVAWGETAVFVYRRR